MTNPYESPRYVGQDSPVDPGDREKLRRVALQQRWMLYVLLTQIVSGLYCSFAQVAQSFHVGTQRASEVLLLYLPYWAAAIFCLVRVFLLAKELMHIVIAMICAVLTLMPCISILITLVLSRRATRLLKQHGVKVGLMGANPDLI
ncbi:MAG TPA: hypothetical protein VGI40_06845 [Pirellulaceae bacterium]|jgi:hypothetical protein